MRLLLLLVVLGLSGIPAHAADCSDAQTQADMNECARTELKQADDRLNRLYGEIQQRLKGEPNTATLLTSAQRAWVTYRDAECGFSSFMSTGGSIHGMVEAQCLNGLTETRSEDFIAYLNCQDGDLSCPVPRK